MSTAGTAKVWTSVSAVVIGAVFTLESGYVNDLKVPGGATNHGITEQIARDNGYEGEMQDLTRDFEMSHQLSAKSLWTPA